MSVNTLLCSSAHSLETGLIFTGSTCCFLRYFKILSRLLYALCLLQLKEGDVSTEVMFNKLGLQLHVASCVDCCQVAVLATDCQGCTLLSVRLQAGVCMHSVVCSL